MFLYRWTERFFAFATGILLHLAMEDGAADLISWRGLAEP